MTVIHILMAPRYLYNNRFTIYVITEDNCIKVYQTRHVLRNNALGVYVARIDVDTVRHTQLNCYKLVVQTSCVQFQYNIWARLTKNV